MEIQKSLRYRVNVSTSVKGVKTWDCTVETDNQWEDPNAGTPMMMGDKLLFDTPNPQFPLEAIVLYLSDHLVAELEKRYPITEVK